MRLQNITRPHASRFVVFLTVQAQPKFDTTLESLIEHALVAILETVFKRLQLQCAILTEIFASYIHGL